MKEIWSESSTNGRWGLSIVAPEGVELPQWSSPLLEGGIVPLGTVGGVETFRFVPGETGTYILATRQGIKAHGGATVMACRDMQSGSMASIVVLGQEAVVEMIGYKGRSSTISAYIGGVRKPIPASVLLAMGLVQSESGSAAVFTPPPVMVGEMAAAFAALRG